MLTLKDSVEIAAPPDAVEQWLMNIEEHYREWHPDHVKWVNLEGALDEGKTFYYEEYLHGRLYKSRCRITRLARDGKTVIEFKGISIHDRVLGVKGSFTIEPRDGSCTVTATISLRFGRLIPILASGIARDIEKHMKEEGESLRSILEGEPQRS